MKLFHGTGSPFARKVLACAVARGIAGQITLIPTVHDSPDLAAANPLGKLPCLITDDGLALYDSRVICEFFDTIGEGFTLFPAHGSRFRALRLQALADGIMDAAVMRRGEAGRPQEAARDTEVTRQAGKIEQALDALEADPPAAHLDIGTIAAACALGYLDLRFAAENWRAGRPKLAAWFETMSQQPCLSQTKPK